MTAFGVIILALTMLFCGLFLGFIIGESVGTATLCEHFEKKEREWKRKLRREAMKN